MDRMFLKNFREIIQFLGTYYKQKKCIKKLYNHKSLNFFINMKA